MGAMTGNLVIDLSAVRRNYAILDSLSAQSCETAAAVKANAYGLGIGPIANTLQEAGCRTFFVATAGEAIELRAAIGKAGAIAVLHGYDPTYETEYRKFDLTPVLNSLNQIAEYRKAAGKGETQRRAILHFDTGMNRIGIEGKEAEKLNQNKDLLTGVEIALVMSHFISSEEESPLNPLQNEKFNKIAKAYKGVRRSICNSSGIFRSKDYHLDLTRPGMALYGLNPQPGKANPMRPVVNLTVPVLQVRDAQAGETAGYNATHRFNKKTTLAVAALGYADGFFRSLGNRSALYWKGRPLPIRGRVSMDLVICDLENLPEKDWPTPGDALEVLGPNQSADDLAAAAGTIGYEILTALGKRYKRHYKKKLQP